MRVALMVVARAELTVDDWADKMAEKTADEKAAY